MQNYSFENPGLEQYAFHDTVLLKIYNYMFIFAWMHYVY